MKAGRYCRITYDDGGISGGHLDRPALQRLMQAVDEKRVDQIVVYKIDRLTRSLADFAKLVDRLDAAETSFVSVTQSFNTATSMGRLTLNMLLSFAQFEREVTSERIRDKIAASKRKGMWMGGTCPPWLPSGWPDAEDRRDRGAHDPDPLRSLPETGLCTEPERPRRSPWLQVSSSRTIMRASVRRHSFRPRSSPSYSQQPDLCRANPAQGAGL